jgi:proteic killer suppression protein
VATSLSTRFLFNLDGLNRVSFNVLRYTAKMIRSFGDEETERVFQHRHSRKFAAIERVAFRKLRQIHSVSTVEELYEPPGNRLERLKHDREGQWSLRINDQYRVCFEWRDGDAYKVEIVDYH